jgi:hypothetical protein
LKYSVTVDALRAANNIAGDVIHAGQVLVIPVASELVAVLPPTTNPTIPAVTPALASPTANRTPADTLSPTLSQCQYMWFFGNPPNHCAAELPLYSFGVAQRFERGQMIWVKETDIFFILFNANTLPNDSRLAFVWYRSLQLKPGASPDNRVGEAPPAGLTEPVSGFGLIWRGEVAGEFGVLGDQTLRQVLGWAVEPEYGFDMVYQCESPSTYSHRTCYLRGPGNQMIELGYSAYVGNVWVYR